MPSFPEKTQRSSINRSLYKYNIDITKPYENTQKSRSPSLKFKISKKLHLTKLNYHFYKKSKVLTNNLLLDLPKRRNNAKRLAPQHCKTPIRSLKVKVLEAPIEPQLAQDRLLTTKNLIRRGGSHRKWCSSFFKHQRSSNSNDPYLLKSNY